MERLSAKLAPTKMMKLRFLLLELVMVNDFWMKEITEINVSIAC
ncbi:MAG TPA: hypothetical protein VIQ31_24675 [Phormidium sp.]